MWDRVLETIGPIVFDKSPRLLDRPDALEMLEAFRASGRDVRLLAIVRDPRDVIASQFEKWGTMVPGDSPRNRERIWIRQYRAMEALRRRVGFPVFRYEDFASEPRRVLGEMFRWCGLDDDPSASVHVRPTNVGRYARSSHPAVRAWEPADALIEIMESLGYSPRASGAV